MLLRIADRTAAKQLSANAGGNATMDETIREIAKQLHDSQDRYIYFIIAVSGSCIAFAVTRTTDRIPAWSMLILGFAVLSWTGSMVAGLRNRAYHHAILHANMALLRIQMGQEPDVGSHPEFVQAATQGVLSGIETNQQRISKWGDRQTYLLFLGCALFLVWHVVDMFGRLAP
jgi:hypothetical protein